MWNSAMYCSHPQNDWKIFLDKMTQSPSTDTELLQKVEAAIDTMRPYFAADGGDMQLVDITETMVARVRLLGSCRSCQMSAMTIKGGVEEAIKRVAPQISGVEAYEEI